MNNDIISIILRALTLIILAVISQLAIHRKQFSIAFWSLAFWLTLFRLLLLRVLKFYAHQDDITVVQLENLLMYGWPSLFTDIVLVVSTMPLYKWLVNTYKVWLKTTEKL